MSFIGQNQEAPFKGALLLLLEEPIKTSVLVVHSEDSLLIYRAKTKELLFSCFCDDVVEWSFSVKRAFFYVLRENERIELSFRGALEEVRSLCFLWNHLRSHYRSSNKGESFIKCCACGLLISIEGSSRRYFCPECHSMIVDGVNTSQDKSLFFDIDQDGYFSQVSAQGMLLTGQGVNSTYFYYENFLKRAHNVLRKACGHAVWLSLWQLVAWGVGENALLLGAFASISWAACFVMTFVHLFFLGYYLAGLIMTKSLRGLLFLSPVEKFSHLIKKGAFEEVEELIADKKLVGLPGIWFNLSLGYMAKKRFLESRKALSKALIYSPNHPVFLSLKKEIDSLVKE